MKSKYTTSKTILIVNDDGINAPGIKHLYKGLEGLGEIWAVAPVSEKSGVSHAFTLRGPIRVDHAEWVDGQRGWGVHGTPVDAVKLAIRSLMPAVPDLVVSGINRGENTGVDLLYSGTVAAAMEGMVIGVPSIAISIRTEEGVDYTNSVTFARKISREVLDRGLPTGVFLNVNVPTCLPSALKGVLITRQAPSRYDETIHHRGDDSGGESHWVSYIKVLTEDGGGTDFEAIREDYISVTPVQAKLTASELIPMLKEWEL